MIGIAVITYKREEQFFRILNSIKTAGHVIAVKDGSELKYSRSPHYDFYELTENKGVGFCKNLAIEKLLEKGCEHIFILEDDCFVKDNDVWEYCISFSKESGLLHFNWNDYRFKKFVSAQFIKHKAALCHETEANFSYFHKTFLEKVRFDPTFKNAWEHIDLELQGEALGFLPPFRTFVCPDNLEKYLEVIDNGKSTISEMPNRNQLVHDGHEYFKKKWGKGINEMMELPSSQDFYDKMKEITIKYAQR